MSLTDKVIKNTFYYFISQTITFLFPIILTPYIISKIGISEYGLYAIILGLIGSFGLLDLSFSNSFIRFISEYYNRNEKDNLNFFINTGFITYLVFSLIVFIIAFLLTDSLLSFFSIANDLQETAKLSFKIGLLIFLIATSFTMFVSILISIQKMYMTSIVSMLLGVLNLILTIILLEAGWRLFGVMLSQLIIVILSTVANVIIAKKSIPYLRIAFNLFNRDSFKRMFTFGLQIQVSKIAGFGADKLDEFLLGHFSVLGNVTFVNVANRISRFGRFFPFQLFIQAAPVSAELNARNEEKKLERLFIDITKYLTLLSFPIFVFLFAFSDLIIRSWLGAGYEISAYILKIICIGQLINMIISAPGNSIIPNVGIPKYVMYEGIINFILNLMLSYLLIKQYGITGAAIGNTIAFALSSIFIYYTSAKYFAVKLSSIFKDIYLKPAIASFSIAVILYIILSIFENRFLINSDKFLNIVTLIVLGVIFVSAFSFIIHKMNYLDLHDKEILLKLFRYIVPFKFDKNKI